MDIMFRSREDKDFFVREAGFGEEKYYFKIPLKYKEEITDLADPFVILLIFRMMRRGGDMRICGKVSGSLLANLELYASYWNVLFPQTYKKITVTADEEIDDCPAVLPDKAIAAFSGGLDAAFMLYRHKKGLAGRNNRNIEKCVLIAGFDTPLNMGERQEKEFNCCKKMCDDLNAELVPVEINYRYYPTHWHMEHLACAAAVLRLWKNYPYQLIASSHPVNDFKIPWASNPVTDHLLSGNLNKVIVDDIDFTRMEKAELLKDWKTGLENLRLCWNGGDKTHNCGICEKCVRTYLNFRALGIKELPCMSSEFDSSVFKKIAFEDVLHFYNDILNYAEKNNVKDAVFEELKKEIKRQQNKRSKIYFKRAGYALLAKITCGRIREKYQKKINKMDKRNDCMQIYTLK